MGDIWDIKARYQAAMNNDIRGNRGFWSADAVVSYIDVSSAGDAVDFGDMSQSKSAKGGIATPARVIFGGGYTSPAGKKLEHFTPTSLGNGADFGDLSTTRSLYGGAASNHVRGIFMGGEAPAPGHAKQNVIDYITIASLGDASDFGDLTSARFGGGGVASSTRVCYGGGNPGSNTNIIDYGTIASTGNFADFGDLTSVRRGCPGANSTTRGLIFKGADASSPEPDQKFIDYFEIATTGNASDFGDATVLGRFGGALSNNIRGVSAGGSDPSTNTIDYVTITTTGDAADFGDLLSTTNPTGACVGHGGIDMEILQRPSVNYMPGSGRGLFCGGETPTYVNTIDRIVIPTLGNAADFGDLVSVNGRCPAGCSSLTRGLVSGGSIPGAYLATIDAFSLLSEGNAFDFGDLASVAQSSYGAGGTTRAFVNLGSVSDAASNVINYMTIATAGDASDFGDLTTTVKNHSACSSSTRGVAAGGYGGSPAGYLNVIDYITIASTGDATDFGDLTDARNTPASCGSSTRGLWMAGGDAAEDKNVIDYVTIASTGDATDFGDLTAARSQPNALSSNVRGICGGGAAPSVSNVMDYVTIASTGDAADFGDLSAARNFHTAVSDSHGGLQH